MTVEPTSQVSAMMARLQEIETSYNRRLANQKQVIENLSEARQELLGELSSVRTQLALWQEFGQYIASMTPEVYAALASRAQELLNQKEI